MGQTTNTNFLDNLVTPKQLADRGILSLVSQWKQRNRGALKFYQIGRKIFYDTAQISEFFASCESGRQTASRNKDKFTPSFRTKSI